jgi:hypothetical protein
MVSVKSIADKCNRSSDHRIIGIQIIWQFALSFLVWIWPKLPLILYREPIKVLHNDRGIRNLLLMSCRLNNFTHYGNIPKDSRLLRLH